eukprot:GHVN01060053.1.p1 GENE.GHVN01060053.1~~GHVN01060053.1.p1  ORF type:complete len:608 (+),score=44.08 GHVN01060053.1:722-2545(+)
MDFVTHKVQTFQFWPDPNCLVARIRILWCRAFCFFKCKILDHQMELLQSAHDELLSGFGMDALWPPAAAQAAKPGEKVLKRKLAPRTNGSRQETQIAAGPHETPYYSTNSSPCRVENERSVSDWSRSRPRVHREAVLHLILAYPTVLVCLVVISFLFCCLIALLVPLRAVVVIIGIVVFSVLLMHQLWRTLCQTGLSPFLPVQINTLLSETSLFDVFYRVVVTGRVPFYFSRLVILLWVSPTDQELISILEGCDPSFVRFLMKRGVINHLPATIRHLYSPSPNLEPTSPLVAASPVEQFGSAREGSNHSTHTPGVSVEDTVTMGRRPSQKSNISISSTGIHSADPEIPARESLPPPHMERAPFNLWTRTHNRPPPHPMYRHTHLTRSLSSSPHDSLPSSPPGQTYSVVERTPRAQITGTHRVNLSEGGQRGTDSSMAVVQRGGVGGVGEMNKRRRNFIIPLVWRLALRRVVCFIRRIVNKGASSIRTRLIRLSMALSIFTFLLSIRRIRRGLGRFPIPAIIASLISLYLLDKARKLPTTSPPPTPPSDNTPNRRDGGRQSLSSQEIHLRSVVVAQQLLRSSLKGEAQLYACDTDDGIELNSISMELN